jgi:hypothetical protein
MRAPATHNANPPVVHQDAEVDNVVDALSTGRRRFSTGSRANRSRDGHRGQGATRGHRLIVRAVRNRKGRTPAKRSRSVPRSVTGQGAQTG